MQGIHHHPVNQISLKGDLITNRSNSEDSVFEKEEDTEIHTKIITTSDAVVITRGNLNESVGKYIRLDIGILIWPKLSAA